MTPAVAITDIPASVDGLRPSKGRAKIEDTVEIAVWSFLDHPIELYDWIGVEKRAGNWVVTEHPKQSE